jgi:hypothetical protein
MYNIYRSDYSNQVHQLVVSVSRHYYITKQGKYQYQKKPFEVDLGESSSKLHVVHYLIRDHFSGLFYAELTDTQHLIPIREFLYRAWSEKREHPFLGVPSGITVPKNVQKLWPAVAGFLAGLGIEVIKVTSGFQGGVRDIRTWEDHLKWGLYRSGIPPDFSEVQSQAIETCRQLAAWSVNGEPKERKWRNNLKGTNVPKSREAFLGTGGT